LFVCFFLFPFLFSGNTLYPQHASPSSTDNLYFDAQEEEVADLRNMLRR
jgi:hypothetical protein